MGTHSRLQYEQINDFTFQFVTVQVKVHGEGARCTVLLGAPLLGDDMLGNVSKST